MDCPVTIISALNLDPRKFGSMEEYTVFLSRALAERGWRSVLVFSRPLEEPVLSHFKGLGASVEALQSCEGVETYRDLARIQRKYRGDLIHFHFFNQFSLMPVLARLSGARAVVFTDHIREPQRLRRLTRLECRLWDRVVLPLLHTHMLTISEHMKRTLVTCYEMSPERIRVIPNGVSLARFRPGRREEFSVLREEFGIGSRDPVIVCASNLRPEKGIDDLLRATRMLKEKWPQVAAVIVGEGPVRERLQELAWELRIESNVRFAGSRSDVHRIMGMADVVAVPSAWQEPAGLVVIEGMAMGRPVVATRVGGIPEYLEDGVSGILVEPHAPEALARALEDLLKSPERAAAMGQAGRARAERYFSMERWVGATLDVYERALGII